MSDEELDMEQALGALEDCVRKKRKPTRHHARAVLVALGQRLLAGDADQAEAAAAQVSRAVRQQPADWDRAVAEELALAATEFVQSVDPRYLSLPRYDLAYTIAARERLEARLRAAEKLDIAPPDDLLEQIVRADALLEPYLRSRDGRAPAN